MQTVSKAIIDFLKNPINYLLMLGVAFSFYKFSVDGNNQWTISSDGSGYYAYLPALFIYNDPSYVASNKAEAKVHNGAESDNFLFQTQTGRTYNKFFPGEAVMQTPFFLLAHFMASISGAETTGYTEIYQFFFWIGGLFYGILGLVYYQRFLQKYFGMSHSSKWTLALFLLATPVCFYLFFTPSLSHCYSLSLFSLLLYHANEWRMDTSVARNVRIGVLLGLIFLVRPTNLVIVLVLPVLWNTGSNFWEWLREQLNRRRFWISLLGPCLIVCSLLPLAWYWQTGNWLVWSYRGEGFNWLEPNFLRALFSFRSGLLVHAPILIFSLIGCVFWFRKNRFQAMVWFLFTLVHSWILFSWWCWDYESTFGNRPFTEYMVIWFLPVFFIPKKITKLRVLVFSLLALMGLARLLAFENETLTIQRFTKENYLESLLFWKPENKNRWNFTESCEPYGKLLSRKILIQQDELHVKPTDEYVATNLIQLPEKRNGKRYYVRMTCEKRIVGTDKFTDVFFVVDAYNTGFENRNYKIMPLYNDIYEGKNAWKQLTFETQIYDYMEKCSEVKIYVWNPGKRTFELKNIRIELLVFGN